MRGYLALVLHAHLPFVRHPEHPRFLEEHWLYEAITDAYVPLLEVLSERTGRHPGPCLTLSLSPTLVAMLGDPLLQARFLDYLGRRTRLCEAEVLRRRGDPRLAALALGYRERLAGLAGLYRDRLGGDLVGAFAALAKAGVIELMTTAATHGYLPLLRTQPAAVRAQLGVGQDAFEAVFGYRSAGLWLPECGYYEGLEADIAAAGFRYTLVDSHGLTGAVPPPAQGTRAPVEVPVPGGARIAVFGRDPASAVEVWSPDQGYPSHPDYREYHCDLGYTLEPALLDDFLPPGVAAAPTGVKYHRVTGGSGPKELYDPIAGALRARRDATRFVARRRAALEGIAPRPVPPILVCPYDAELFGHWWYEGPAFLAAVLREVDAAGDLEAISLGGYLTRHGTGEGTGDGTGKGTGEIARPAPSSWGEHGYNAAWLTRETGWVYPLLHRAAGELADLVALHLRETGDLEARNRQARILRQAGRSLLLAQASDWPFCIARGSASDYAQSRLRDSLARFRLLAAAARGGHLDPGRLAALEEMDNLFPDLDLTRFV
jgi:1,4-alpha-glucan branching enzyme